MPISEQEQADLVIMNEKVFRAKLEMYDVMKMYLPMNLTQLRQCGQYTVEGAVVAAFKATDKEVNDLIKAHIKKYPD